MMFTYELKDILHEELKNGKPHYGDVYYKDDKGKYHIIDFIEFDKEGNLILSENLDD